MKKRLNLTFTLLLGAFVALGLSACAEGQTGSGADTTATGQDTSSSMRGRRRGGGRRREATTTQTTINLLRGGVRNVASNQAVQNINGWQQKLQQQSSSGQALTKINDNLEQLKTELVAGGPPDGQAIGNLLSQLGRQTTQAAQDTTGPKAQQFQQLGQLLTETGDRLAGGGS